MAQQQTPEARSEGLSSAAVSKSSWGSILRDLNELRREMRSGSTVTRMIDVVVTESAVPDVKVSRGGSGGREAVNVVGSEGTNMEDIG